VFIGKVNSIETFSETIWTFPNRFETYTNKISFQVDKAIKWEKVDTLQVTTPRDSATCGYSFEEWKDYIVYSNLDENNEITVSLCSRTNLLENATEDLIAFNIEWTTNTPVSNEELNTLTIDNNTITTSTKTEEINSNQVLNIEKQKNVYIWITVWIFALALIVFCMISMNKKD
jgi:hypothetical protein